MSTGETSKKMERLLAERETVLLMVAILRASGMAPAACVREAWRLFDLVTTGDDGKGADDESPF